MNGIQGTKTAGQQWNRLLDAVVTIIKYKKITVDHAIYIKGLSDVTVSCLTVSNYDALDTTNNETSFPELTIVFEENFEVKFQEGSVLKYLKFRIFQYPIDLSVDQIYHTTELVNE